MLYGIKQVIELKNESTSLYEVINMVFDKYLGIITKKNNFQYMLLPRIFRNKDSPNTYTYVLVIVTMIHLLIIYHQVD